MTLCTGVYYKGVILSPAQPPESTCHPLILKILHACTAFSSKASKQNYIIQRNICLITRFMCVIRDFGLRNSPLKWSILCNIIQQKIVTYWKLSSFTYFKVYSVTDAESQSREISSTSNTLPKPQSYAELLGHFVKKNSVPRSSSNQGGWLQLQPPLRFSLVALKR